MRLFSDEMKRTKRKLFVHSYIGPSSLTLKLSRSVFSHVQFSAHIFFYTFFSSSLTKALSCVSRKRRSPFKQRWTFHFRRLVNLQIPMYWEGRRREG